MNAQEREHRNHVNDVFSTRITIYRNGDLNFYGKKLVVNRKHIRTFNSFLDEVTRDTQAKVAVRSIRTPNHGTIVANLDRIENGGVYVAVGLEKFKHLPYKEIPTHDNLSLRHHLKPPAKPIPHNRIYASARYQKLAVSEPLCNRIILVYRNGDDLYPGKKLLLDKRLLENMDTLLQYITDKIKLTTGAVRSLHTLDGSVIKETSQLETGVKYVAVGYQKHFVKGIYLNESEPFNVSIKKIHHKALKFKKNKKKKMLNEDKQEVKNDRHLNETHEDTAELVKTAVENLNVSSTDEEKNLKSEFVLKRMNKVASNNKINQQDTKIDEAKVVEKNMNKVASNNKINQQDPQIEEAKVIEKHMTKAVSSNKINQEDPKVDEGKSVEQRMTNIASNNKINMQSPKVEEAKVIKKISSKNKLSSEMEEENEKENILQNQSIQTRKKSSLSQATVKNIYSKSLPTKSLNINELDSCKPLKILTSNLSMSHLKIPPNMSTEEDSKIPPIFQASGETMETANEVIESHETNIEPAVEMVPAKEVQDEEIEKENEVKLSIDG
ncbi:doublecortin domain-containing protein 2 isoform X1 [Hydra vulgaris]|uniref:doublecortin domain-containing protein 2 isoform X1 n=1 Tax=Hydra vulgaris TaxID=6087 RepID=UPI001F5F577B|nr:doublecortin domain-containing protein 2 [Hydra vulgaris]